MGKWGKWGKWECPPIGSLCVFNIQFLDLIIPSPLFSAGGLR